MNDPRAGQPAQPSDLVDVAHLVTAYYTLTPDPDDLDQQVAFGTSGHRGSSLRTAFNEDAHPRDDPGDLRLPRVAGLRRAAVHRPRHPRPVRARLGLGPRGARRQRRHRPRRRPRRLHPHAGGVATPSSAPTRAGPTRAALADGIVVTPSHNPPYDGGFKYNPPHGGPADTDATKVIAARANELIAGGLDGVRRIPFSRARGTRSRYDFLGTYVDDLPDVVDLAAHQGGRRPHRRRPARWRGRRLLGRDRRPPRARPHRRQPARRPDLALHDARLGRQDPDGLLARRRRWPR